MKTRLMGACVRCLAWLVLPVLAATAAAAEAPPLLLTHVTVIDGSGAAPQAKMTIAIDGKHIAAIYPDGSRAVPKGAQVEDLAGKYAIPGLIDAHVHLTGAEPDIPHYAAHLQALLRGGVTAVRDMAGDDRLVGYLAGQANTDLMPAPDIAYVALMAGPSFFTEDVRAQGSTVGVPLGTAPWMRAITPDTDLRLAVAEAKGTGASALKLYANLMPDLVAKVTAEAHRQGMQVWAHATIFPTRPSEEVAAGVDVLSHTPYLVWQAAATVPADYRVRAMGDFTHVRPDAPAIVALLKSMREHGTILDATLTPFLDEAEHQPQKVGAGIMDWSYAVTRFAHEMGVAVDVGADSSGLPRGAHGVDLTAMPLVHAEMALLVAHCGFTPLEAIHAATAVGAAAMGQSDRRGTLAAGKLADVVVLSADPSRDIHNTTRIEFVVKHGRIEPSRNRDGGS